MVPLWPIDWNCWIWVINIFYRFSFCSFVYFTEFRKQKYSSSKKNWLVHSDYSFLIFCCILRWKIRFFKHLMISSSFSIKESDFFCQNRKFSRSKWEMKDRRSKLSKDIRTPSFCSTRTKTWNHGNLVV